MKTGTEQTTYTASSVEEMLRDAIEVGEFTADDRDGFLSVRTYELAGIMTSNRGLVLRMQDGSEFQISIVQSR